MKRISSLIALVLCVGFIASMLTNSMNPYFATLLAVGIIGGAAMLPKPKSRNPFDAVAGIDTQIWLAHVLGNFFKNNEFILRSADDSQYVNNLTVNIPNAGPKAAITKNRVLGGAATNTVIRTDQVLSYNIDEYTSDPFLITDAEEKQLSYNKRESVLKEIEMALREATSNDIIYSWAPTNAGNILRTTGFYNNSDSEVRSTAILTSGSATGLRKVMTLWDVRAARDYGNRNNWPQEGRCMMLSANQYSELCSDLAATKYRNTEANYDLKNGVLQRVEGFDIYMRSDVLQSDNSATPVKKAVGAAGAADDNDTALFWQEDMVRRAIGSDRMFATENSATNYGDVYSLLNRFGGSRSYQSQFGVGLIVQEAAI